MRSKCRTILRTYGAHLAVLLTGTALLVGGCFQNSLWFDESYTVGLMHHTLPDVLRWATYDVHPHLYYLLLKIFTLLFGTSLPAMRLFSVLGAVLLAGLGLTHLRRDFGSKIGFWFSFCTLFCASTLAYALQIRMYTWAAFFVALAILYAYRMETQQGGKRNRVLFLLFSLCAAYTHYFGLFAVAACNLILLYRTCKDKRPLKFWLQNAAIQIVAYIPGALVFLRQISLNGAAWIRIEWPDLIFDLTSYHLLGDVLKVFFDRGSEPFLGITYLLFGGLFLTLYLTAGILIWRQIRSGKIDNTQKKVLWSSLVLYFGVILFSLTISLFRVIYYIRYTVVICSLLFFAMAILLASFQKRTIKVSVAVLLLVLCGIQTYYHYDLLYDPSANAVHETLDQEVQADDTFLFDGANSFVVSVQYPENTAYFFNNWHWSVEKTYRAFGPNSYVLDNLDCPEIDSLGSRVWTVDRGICYERLLALGYEETKAFQIHLRYHDSNYEMILMQKEGTS